MEESTISDESNENLISEIPPKQLDQAVSKKIKLPLWRLPLIRNCGIGIVAIALFFVVSGHLSLYRNYQLAEVGPYILALLGLSLLVGQNGQISIGHGALMAIGAWTFALFQLHTKLPLAVLLILATLVTFIFGSLLGLVAARLRGPYLAGTTLALALGLPDIATRYRSLFGGYQGLQITQPSPPAFLGATFSAQQYLAVIDMICIVIGMIIFANLIRSKTGRNMRAVRDDEIASRISGISVQKTQVFAFAVSAGAAGLGGALLALVSSNVSPGAFTLTLSISLLAGMVIGGTGTIAGPIWGAFIMVYVPQWATTATEKLNLNQGIAANLSLGLYGVLLIVIIFLAPMGIQGLLRGGFSKVVLRRQGKLSK